MTERLLVVGLCAAGLSTILIVSFTVAAVIVPADALGRTLPRSGWAPSLVGWGLGGGLVILGVARAINNTDRWPHRTRLGLGLLIGAVAAGVAVEVTMMRWAADRFGVQAADPELIGWSTLLSPMVVLVGVVSLAGTTFHGAGGTAAKLITVSSAAATLLVVASNVPGAANGITPLGMPMGAAMAFAAVVSVTALGASLPRWRSPRNSEEQG